MFDNRARLWHLIFNPTGSCANRKNMMAAFAAGNTERAALDGGLLARFIEDGASPGHQIPNRLFYDLTPDDPLVPARRKCTDRGGKQVERRAWSVQTDVVVALCATFGRRTLLRQGAMEGRRQRTKIRAESAYYFSALVANTKIRLGSANFPAWNQAPSFASRSSLRRSAEASRRPMKPPGVRSEAITRWQGTCGAKGLRFKAWPTARQERQRKCAANCL